MAIPLVTNSTNIFTVANTINRIINEKLETAGGTLTGGLGIISGNTSSPSIKFSATPTTGFYAPATNAIGIVISGSEQVRIHANGNLGMGISNSQSNIEVRKSTNTNIKLSKVAGSTVEMKALTTTSEIGTTVNHPLIIKTNNTEAMRISNTAFVGIGTTSPLSKVEIKPTIGSAVRFGLSGQVSGGSMYATNTASFFTGASYYNGTNWVSTSTNSSLVAFDTGSVRFYTNTGLTTGNNFTPSESVRIDSNGRLGVLNSSPAYEVDITGTIHTTNTLRVHSNTSVGSVRIVTSGSAANTANVNFYTGDGVRRGSLFGSSGYLYISPDNGYVVNILGSTPKINGSDIWHAGNLSPYTQTLNTQTSNYQLVIGDVGKVVEMYVASANTLTVPANATVAFPIGTRIDIVQLGGGQTTVVAAGGVTIRSAGNRYKFNTLYSTASLWKRDTNDWVISGDLVP